MDWNPEIVFLYIYIALEMWTMWKLKSMMAVSSRQIG